MKMRNQIITLCIRSVGCVFFCCCWSGYMNMDGIWHDGNNRNSFSIVTWSVHELTKLEYPKYVIVMEGKSGSITSSFQRNSIFSANRHVCDTFRLRHTHTQKMKLLDIWNSKMHKPLRNIKKRRAGELLWKSIKLSCITHGIHTAATQPKIHIKSLEWFNTKSLLKSK